VCWCCGYPELEDFFFLGESDLAGYRLRLNRHRDAWATLGNFLRAQLRHFGPVWRELENWSRIWASAQAEAAKMGLDMPAVFRRAEQLWPQLEAEPEPLGTPPEKQEVKDQPTPAPPDEPESLERVRRWVEGLPDGEVDAGMWVDFLASLDGVEDAFFLEAFRDEELKRQFDSFETASTDAEGNLSGRRRKRIRRFVEKLGDGVELHMLKMPGGEFLMGAEGYAFEQPVHKVGVPDFYLGKHAVTQAQWRAVARLLKVNVEMGEEDSYFKGDAHPAECVSRAEAEEFCARLSRETGRRYRLPSEAEWEYACRAGSRGPFTFGQTLTPSIANYDGGRPFGRAPHGVFRCQTVAVGSLGVANDFGLCDMHGNVCEWCADEWHDTYAGAPADGSAWAGGGGDPAYGVTRGGSWAHAAEVCRASDRVRESTDAGLKLHYLGFRVALDL
jgi:formylglycine-generating enzyme required for sulfatase activity